MKDKTLIFLYSKSKIYLFISNLGLTCSFALNATFALNLHEIVCCSSLTSKDRLCPKIQVKKDSLEKRHLGNPHFSDTWSGVIGNLYSFDPQRP